MDLDSIERNTVFEGNNWPNETVKWLVSEVRRWQALLIGLGGDAYAKAMDVETYKEERDRLKEANAALKKQLNAQIEMANNAVLSASLVEWMSDALREKPLSDFAYSFPEVSGVADLMIHVRSLEQHNKELRDIIASKGKNE